MPRIDELGPPGAPPRRIEEFETVEIGGRNSPFEATLGVSTRLFVTDGHLERRRLDAIACMHRYYRAFQSHLAHYLTSTGGARPLHEQEAFDYFRSEAGVDDPNVQALLLGLAGFPDAEPVPLRFETRLGMQMASWQQYDIYSEWDASTTFSALGEPYHMASRYRDLADGSRQITALVLPGDLSGLYAVPVAMDHSVATLTLPSRCPLSSGPSPGYLRRVLPKSCRSTSWLDTCLRRMCRVVEPLA